MTKFETLTLEYKNDKENYMSTLDICIDYYKTNTTTDIQFFLSAIVMSLTVIVYISTFFLGYIITYFPFPSFLISIILLIPVFYTLLIYVKNVSILNALYLAKLQPDKWELKVKIDRKSKNIISADTNSLK